MASNLKRQRSSLNKRIMKINELGVPVVSHGPEKRMASIGASCWSFESDCVRCLCNKPVIQLTSRTKKHPNKIFW
ncbi:hypothetical protein JHK84_054902 [Glycine max]|nr:hypothetical protein JHK84_054902 [Glycine max]